MKRRPILLAAGLAGAIGFFSLGWLASRGCSPSDAPPAPRAQGASETPDAGPHEPILLLDASSIVLLPDASLRIDPPVAPFEEP
ncbi:hypothetical protein [Polyangium mundeleinium]|uniref:Uncharacterized protein n=1 Tax=Polyangium mundeleinium TaxID=2995306 RepID=A0ABT5F2V8_9BACT|nr:hypothetical protein [Polyangium mundeleinium]MDC0747817.1 hypothetical protein [Polyangium mundeleinium]